MSTTASKLESAVVIKYKTGLDKNGKDVIESQRFSKVGTAVTDQAVYDTAQVIGTLLNYPITQIVRDDQSSIINE